MIHNLWLVIPSLCLPFQIKIKASHRFNDYDNPFDMVPKPAFTLIPLEKPSNYSPRIFLCKNQLYFKIVLTLNQLKCTERVYGVKKKPEVSFLVSLISALSRL